MPIQNRQEQDAQRLKGVNLFDDPIDVEFGAFTSLANWIHGLFYSIRKKRGVASVPSGAMLPISICLEPFADAVMCGGEQVFACGEAVLWVVGMSQIVCGTDVITGLSGSEIVCA